MARERPPYQEEPPDEVRQEIWAAERITPLQLFRIGAWKSAKGLARLSLNSEETIADVSGRALRALRPFRTVNLLHGDFDWADWAAAIRAAVHSDNGGLKSLHGVGYPMATAFLAYLAPGAFPVIDMWTVRAVFGPHHSYRWHNTDAYTTFTQRLCTLQPEHYKTCATIHAVDVAVMNAMMGCADPRATCSHVPFSAIPLPR